MSSLPCIFLELLTAVDCHLVLRSDETVFGAGRDLRLHACPSGPWPVITLHLLQQGLPSGVQLSVGTPDSPTDAAIYYIGDCRIGVSFRSLGRSEKTGCDSGDDDGNCGGAR